MPKIRMIVIEGEMSVDDAQRLAKAFSADDAAFTSVALPNGVTAQAATMNKEETKPRPRPIEVPVIEEVKTEPVPVVDAVLPPTPVPAAVMKVFPEAEVVAADEPTPLLETLLACKRLAGILEILQQAGHADLPALIAACKTYREQVPLLQRLGEGLEDRVTRTFEGMK